MRRISLILSTLFLLMACSSNEATQGIIFTPKEVVANWEAQSVEITANQYFDVDYVLIGESWEEGYHGVESFYIMSEDKSYAFECEWLRWVHDGPSGVSTLYLEENTSGVTRKAYVAADNGDVFGRFYITQLAKE